MTEKSLLREKVLVKDTSPERLDELLKTTQTGAWLLVFVVGLVFLTLLIWGFMGTISVKVNGLGVLMARNSIVNITYNQPGEIADVAVKEGDIVLEGQYLAKIDLPKLALDIFKARETIALSTDKEQIKQTFVNLLTMETESQRENIYSPINGRVMEVNMNKGDAFNANNVIMRISEGNLNRCEPAIIYLSAEDGTKVHKNMKVLLAPTNVSTDEFGNIVGIVKEVSGYVRSNEALVKEVNSAEMARKIMEFTRNAPIMVLVEPQLSTTTTSGYVWTTETGPPFRIKEGTVCNANVIVRKERPIAMIISWLKNFLRVE